MTNKPGLKLREAAELEDPGTMTTEALSLNPDDLKDANINFESLQNNMEKRRLSRVRCYGFLLLSLPDGRIIAKGALRNVSLGGAGLEIKSTPLVVGDEFFVEFSGPPSLALSQLKVAVKTVQPVPSSPDGNLFIGVEFVGLTTAFQNKLAQFIEDLKSGKSEFAAE